MTLQERKDWITLARKTYNVREKRKLLEIQEKELFEKLIEKSNGKPFSYGGFKLDSIIRKGGLDYTVIIDKHLKGVNVEEFRKQEIISWKLAVTKAKE